VVDPFQTTRLRSTAAVLSRVFTFYAFGTGRSGTAVALLSAPPVTPPIVLDGQILYLDPFALEADSFPLNSQYVRSLAVPSDPSLAGAELRLQMMHVKPDFSLRTTNAVELYLGL
ncbi:MAG: hypothetical protein F6K03_08870, partial [Kamptonema sp. SIO4C4]|nr:hypothetical protein [Kamptonema sp. SIO4C4]